MEKRKFINERSSCGQMRAGLSIHGANAFLCITLGTHNGQSKLDTRLVEGLEKIGYPLQEPMTELGWVKANVMIMYEAVNKWETEHPGIPVIPPSKADKRREKKRDKKLKKANYVLKTPSSNRLRTGGYAQRAPSNGKVTKFYTPNTSENYVRLTYEQANAPGFLESYEWRTLRMAVFAKYGNACMCCGAKPNPGLGIYATVDHILSRKKRPDLALCFDNLQVTCQPCNHGKSNWDETDWRPKTVETNSVVVVDSREPSAEDVEYADMATIRFLQVIAGK